MKAYTDLEQSKKLAEILPLESADMSYRPYREDGGISDYQSNLCPYRFASWCGFPCWSLAALLSILPKQVILSGNAEDAYWYCTCEDAFKSSFADSNNPVDACYNMILKLHELKYFG